MPGNDYDVLVPMSELLALYEAVSRRNASNKELEQLRREVDGLRSIQRELMSMVSDLRRQINQRKD